IADESAIGIRNDAIIDLNNDDETIGSLASPSGTTGTVVFGSGTLRTGGDNRSTTWNAGNLGGSGSGGLAKEGAGSFRLASSGSYTFTGAININTGTLLVDGVLATSAVAPGVFVNSDGQLGGTGTLNRALLVNSGGTVSPGDSGLEIPDPTTTATGILSTG